jgi:hypothetical protein
VKRGLIVLGVIAVVTVVALFAVRSIGVHNYREFRGAVDSGATCSQLWDIEKNFEGTADEERIVSDLKELGCYTASSVRHVQE